MSQVLKVHNRVQPQQFSSMLFVDYVQLALFIAYAFSYTFYMADIIPRAPYYVCLAALVAFATLRFIGLILKSRPGAALIFGKSTAALAIASVVLVLLSIINELVVRGDFTYTSFGAVGFILVPAVIALCIANTVSLRMADVYMTILLARYVIYILISGDFSLAALSAISWSSSTSPFESSFSHDMLVLVMYFVVRQQSVRSGIAAFFTMISLKRAAFLSAPLFLIFRRWIRKPVIPKHSSLIMLLLAGIISPFVVQATYSSGFSRLFYDYFGVSFDDFASGRVSIYRLAVHCADTSQAFGSLNECLGNVAYRVGGTTWNSLLHNDTLRVYMEVGIIGVAVYLGALVFVGRTSRPAFILMTYTFFVLITSRLITHMSYWIVLFIVIALLDLYYSTTRSHGSDEGEPITDAVRNRTIDEGSK
ncbi:hypothetical protein IM25_02680 [Rhodococcus sp. p52]|uniref:hypothetical protein n=1 Tax=Rhodococcus sp. p52 TaxID=935199 RepID=UPI000519F659|nr:hypothetical protein [Rhodococcus sp. p52]AOD20676.1 hypothetical protein IM25_02680 [Rhodococcus sp. p52]